MTLPNPTPAPATRRRRRWPWILGGGVIAIVLAVVGGTYVYIHFIQGDAPPKLSFETIDAATTVPADAGSTATTAAPSATTAAGTDTGASTASDGITGTWAASSDSQLGYRVKEVLFGQSTEGVGRTNNVTGQLVIDGTTVNTGTFSVDMTTLKSDESRRDDQFNGRIMNTATYPTATFTLTQPIDVGTLPADKTPITVKATGDLTLRGVTKSVTIDLSARRNGATIEVTGSIPIVFADWSIPNPGNGAVTTEDNGLIEFVLVFNQA